MSVATKQPMGGAHKPYKLTGKINGSKKPAKKKK
jgi:hypothetical protein